MILVNVKIFVSTSSHTGWSVFWQIGSIALFYCAVAYLSYFEISFMETELLGVFRRLIMYLTNYLLLFLTVVAFIFVDVGMWYIDQ